jgi:hypothetical protein
VLPSSNVYDDVTMSIATMSVYIRRCTIPLLLPQTVHRKSRLFVRTVAKQTRKRGEIFYFIFCLTLKGKSISLLKFFLLFRCVFEAIFKLKFLGFRNHFLHKLYVLLRFSCIICMYVIAHHILFDLYG